MPVIVLLLDNLSLGDCLGQNDAFLVVLQTGEYLVRIAVEKPDESHPLLLVVLETHNIALQLLGSHLRNLGMCARTIVLGVVLLVFLRDGNHDSRAAAVAIDGASLAPRTPCLDIKPVDKSLVHIVREVNRDTDAVVNPFLDFALHLHLHQPVHVVGGSFIIR